MTLKYIWRSFSLGCHFHVDFSYPWICFRVARSPSNSWASCLKFGLATSSPKRSKNEDRAKVTINGLYKVVHGLSIALYDVWARFKVTDTLNAAKMMKYGLLMASTKWHANSVFTVRRYALHSICYSNFACPSVRLSVRLSVCHTRGLCPHCSTYDQDFITTG